MSNNKFIKYVAAASLAACATAAVAQVETFSASMDLVDPITILNPTPLDMAAIDITNGAVCQVNGDATTSGAGCLGGTPVGGVVNLTGAVSTAYTISVGGVAGAPTGVTFVPFFGTTLADTTLATETFSAGGAGSHTVGGQVTVGAGASAETNASVSYDVTVTYN